MARLPRRDVFGHEEKVLVALNLGRDVDHRGGTDEAVGRNRVAGVVGEVFARHPMDRRVKVCAGVLAEMQSVPVPGRGPAWLVARDHFHRKSLATGQTSAVAR